MLVRVSEEVEVDHGTSWEPVDFTEKIIPRANPYEASFALDSVFFDPSDVGFVVFGPTSNVAGLVNHPDDRVRVSVGCSNLVHP